MDTPSQSITSQFARNLVGLLMYMVQMITKKEDLYGQNCFLFQTTAQRHGVLVVILISGGGHMNVFLSEEIHEARDTSTVSLIQSIFWKFLSEMADTFCLDKEAKSLDHC